MRNGSSRRHARNAKLTLEKVLDIRRRAGNNPQGDRHHYRGWSYSELAKMHGISKGLVGRVVRREEWSDVPEEDDLRESAGK